MNRVVKAIGLRGRAAQFVAECAGSDGSVVLVAVVRHAGRVDRALVLVATAHPIASLVTPAAFANSLSDRDRKSDGNTTTSRSSWTVSVLHVCQGGLRVRLGADYLFE